MAVKVRGEAGTRVRGRSSNFKAMSPETVAQDVRIGFRILRRERAFSALAILVLALGICGVTTMFSVVNGTMLRGFSFPNADRLASANFVDPASANFFGVNGQITAMDFEEIRPVQQSFERLAAYLNGSTVNVTVDGHPQRYTGAYTTEDFLPSLGITPIMGRDFTAADNKPGAEKVALIGYGIWQRDFGGTPDIVGKNVRINGKPATIIGVMPQGFAFPDQRRALAAALQRVSSAATQRPVQRQPGRPRRAEAGRVARSGECRIRGVRAAAGEGISGHQQAVQHRSGAAAHRLVHAASAARHAVHDARVLRRRAAHRVRERDEHAVRSRDAAGQGTGGPLVARRHADQARPPDADGEPARRDDRCSDRCRVVVFHDGLAASNDSQPGQPAAGLHHVRCGRRRTRGQRRCDDPGCGRVGTWCRHGCRRATMRAR